MNKDVLNLVEAIANKEGVNQETIFTAIEEALASVAEKRMEEDISAAVEIDRSTGDYLVYRTWLVVPDDISSQESMDLLGEEGFIDSKHILLSRAKELDEELNAGDIIRDMVDQLSSGRIDAQHARQAIMQKVREIQRNKIRDDYKSRIGEMMMATVKRVVRSDHVLLELPGGIEAILPHEEMIPREIYRTDDRIRAILLDVDPLRRGPQLILSRASNKLLVELFKLEVPEIGEEVIEIMGAARDPGVRAKIAVKTNDGRIDPIGACVGMRGSRVQTVSNELNSERIDIVLWDEKPAQLVINAMSPAEVGSIVMDEERQSMDIAVKEEQLSLAIGRSGQNIRLASQLTGWQLNVMSIEEAGDKQENEVRAVLELFVEALDVDEDLAGLLAQEGVTTLEDLAFIAPQELLSIEDLDEEIVEELQSRARDALTRQQLQLQEQIKNLNIEEGLLNLKDMEPAIIIALSGNKITTLDDFAELSVDELLDIENIKLDKQRAAALIMQAREHWFQED